MIKIPFITRLPDRIPAGQKSESLQSVVDLAPTFLSFADIDIPRDMTGVDQTETWSGGAPARDHVIVENHHQPTTIHVKTYVNDRYKITAYMDRKYGEIFDLQEDPDELENLWDNPFYQELKMELLQKLISAEMKKEPMWMPRVSNA